MAIDIRQQLALCLAALNNIHHVREDVHKAPNNTILRSIYWLQGHICIYLHQCIDCIWSYMKTKVTNLSSFSSGKSNLVIAYNTWRRLVDRLSVSVALWNLVSFPNRFALECKLTKTIFCIKKKKILSQQGLCSLMKSSEAHGGGVEFELYPICQTKGSLDNNYHTCMVKKPFWSATPRAAVITTSISSSPRKT